MRSSFHGTRHHLCAIENVLVQTEGEKVEVVQHRARPSSLWSESLFKKPSAAMSCVVRFSDKRAARPLSSTG